MANFAMVIAKKLITHQQATIAGIRTVSAALLAAIAGIRTVLAALLAAFAGIRTVSALGGLLLLLLLVLHSLFILLHYVKRQCDRVAPWSPNRGNAHRRR